MKMFRRVFIFGRITAAHVPTFEAHPQMQPCVAGFDAILTDVFVGLRELDLIEM